VFFLKALLKVFAVAAFITLVTKPLMAEQYIIPQDSVGQIPGDISLVGVDVIDATGTRNYGITSPVILYGVCVSSDVVTNYAQLRDTDTLNSTSDIAMTVFPDGQSTNAAQTLCTRLPAPVIFRNGLSITLGNAVGSTTKGRWQFFVRRRLIGNARGTDTSFSATSASD